MPIDQVRTLLAVVDEGTFDAAAAALHVTPSAVSQRIKALEQSTGRVLLLRTKPVRLTESGEVVVRFARQLARLELDARVELGMADAGEPAMLPIAVNADSLATWFLPVLPTVTTEHEVVFDVHKEDEGVSAALLRDGTVMAAVTAEPAPVQGCTSVPLGAMRYVPMASRAFHQRYLDTDRPLGTSLTRAPMLNFSRDDTLQHKYLRRLTRRRIDPPTHFIPSSEAFNEAIRSGLGWGLLPEQDLRPGEEDAPDGLVRLDGRHVDVPLFWQHWRLDSTLLRALTEEVRATAARSLR